MESHEIKIALEKIRGELKPTFGDDLDMQALLFIIGLQELGHGYRKMHKEEKVDVMHIAICTLLAPYGYYKFVKRDEDNWPHFESAGSLPHLSAAEQNRLMLESMVNYFRKKGVIK